MKIGVVGLGYVGIVTAAALAENKNEIVCVDIDPNKIKRLESGDPVIYEPDLKPLLKKNLKRMTFSLDYNKLNGCEAVFLSVPTPTKNGKADLSYVMAASKDMARIDRDVVLVVKSTVLPGTAAEFAQKTGLTIISNPEFTKEGTAVDDTLHPDRIVIGGSNKSALDLVERIWSFTGAPVIKTTNENAELIKYASNAFLATKISFINEIANLAEHIPGTDVEVIARGMGYDKRISPYFLKAGIGYGGSCLPKDTLAFSNFAKELGENLEIVEAAMKINDRRVEKVLSLIKKYHKNLKGKKVAVLEDAKIINSGFSTATFSKEDLVSFITFE
ncbi:MAG: UDP-glucose/GDP-mannose dehydrogenase family protein, partial [Candidatus Micrarchaeota archaeon]|nr:UDP-glucose/GDP-mannose dehydrogenase family protein [Candidatus Micrarchaeota archaeon]